jgi:hypothetical protein
VNIKMVSPFTMFNWMFRLVLITSAEADVRQERVLKDKNHIIAMKVVFISSSQLLCWG